jgi:hypothetical protein
MKTIFIYFLSLVLGGEILTAKPTQKGTNYPPLSQFSKTGVQLEVLAYIERYGEIHSGFGPVAGIGDVNKDGFDDVLIGNYYKGAGEAYIFFGGSPMDTTADIILHGEYDGGEYDGDYFGIKVSSAGDVNGDNDPDFMISATGYPNRKGIGRVYLYFGGAVFDTIPDMIFTGEKSYQDAISFGLKTAHGDVNSDGCDDLLISAPNVSTLKNHGIVYLYLGGAYLDTIPDWTNMGDSAKAYLGMNLAIGDINGDKKKDLIINSTPRIPHNIQGACHVVTEIFLNHSGFDTTASFSITDTNRYNYQFQVLSCNDFNKDGYADMVINMNDKTNIYYGGAEPDTIPNSYIEPWGLIYINRLADAGDVNGDGYPDILAGHFHPIFESSSVGIYLGGKQINPIADWTAGGAGKYISSAGDVNGDGCDDIIVSTLTVPYTSVTWGQAWILAGTPKLVDIGSVVEEKKQVMLLKNFRLQNYPNPFNGNTTITYTISEKNLQVITLKIYDISGKEVISLLSERQAKGTYQVQWNGTNQIGKEVASGLYFCILRTGRFQQTIKLLLLR